MNIEWGGDGHIKEWVGMSGQNWMREEIIIENSWTRKGGRKSKGDSIAGEMKWDIKGNCIKLENCLKEKDTENSKIKWKKK